MFEDQKLSNTRSDHIFKYSTAFFKNSKHKEIFSFSQLLYYLPYQLNYLNFSFCLQVNDYIMISYFKDNCSSISAVKDSSFENDTGKKLTAMVVLFPEDLDV